MIEIAAQMTDIDGEEILTAGKFAKKMTNYQAES